MPSNSQQDTKSKSKKKSILVYYLYIAIILFFFWLLGFSWLLFLKEPNKDISIIEKVDSFTDNNLNKKEGIKASEDLKESERATEDSSEEEKSLGDPERDEFQPSMEVLFEDKELEFESIDEVFDDLKSPKRPQINSTFGKEVVYIYHSHSRESFLPYLKSTYEPEEAYHSKANITLIGKMLGKELENKGIGTSVDTSDIVELLKINNLDYSSSYEVSRGIVKNAQDDNKDLEYFIDVHRDSLRKENTTIDINGVNYARLLFVVGNGHVNFDKNLTFAKELQAMLDTLYPGLSKGILQKSSLQGNGIYNQDLSPNSIILEIGGVDNTTEELHRSTEAFAAVLSNYYWQREE